MIPAEARAALAEVLGQRVRFDVALARHTALRVGGPADALASPGDRGELREVLAVCAAHALPHQVLGAGFNTLALDSRCEGVTLHLGRFRGLEQEARGALRVEAGVSHSQLTRFCCQHGLSGLEFGAGIPGTFGGWLAMNAGIPEREIGAAVRELEVIEPGGRTRHLPREALGFEYRCLRGLAPGSVIVSALVAVTQVDAESVRGEVERLLARRAETQPLDVPTFGSVFKNPPGDHAGRLIESVGLKGHRIGGAQISPLHANFISNLGEATAADVLALMEAAREAVKAATGVRLEAEVRIMGQSS